MLFAATAGAGDWCDGHFGELRRFVEANGRNALVTSENAGPLQAELDVERLLWQDEVERHRNRLQRFNATEGLVRLDAIDSQIKTLFDDLERSVVRESTL
ncbi:MAG: hypothetical protein GY856_18550, partial [bacterium]|nr:hypothetical protein [bacterium]